MVLATSTKSILMTITTAGLLSFVLLQEQFGSLPTANAGGCTNLCVLKHYLLKATAVKHYMIFGCSIYNTSHLQNKLTFLYKQ